MQSYITYTCFTSIPYVLVNLQSSSPFKIISWFIALFILKSILILKYLIFFIYENIYYLNDQKY